MSEHASKKQIDASSFEVPPEFLQAAGFEQGDTVEVTAQGDEVVVRAVSDSDTEDPEALIEELETLTAEAAANREKRDSPDADELDVHSRSFLDTLEKGAQRVKE